MEKVLSGCPNLKCLELEHVWGIHRLEISSVKLRKLIINNYENDENAPWLEIFGPYLQDLQLLGLCNEIRLLHVPSFLSAVLYLSFVSEDEDSLEKEYRSLEELLHSVAHVTNLEVGPWYIELKGWQSPPSSWKFLKLKAALEKLDFPGICSFLQSSSDLEALVIDWDNDEPRNLLSRYNNVDE